MTEKVVIGNATEKVTAIYALVDFDSDRPRYVGKTTQFLRDRQKAHIRDAKRGGQRPVQRWLRKQISMGKVSIRLIEYVAPFGDWAAREKFWIEKFRSEHGDLLNIADGGEGCAGISKSPEHREKIASALRRGQVRACLQCGVQFWRKPNQIKRGHDKFCSRKCGNVFNKGGWPHAA